MCNATLACAGGASSGATVRCAGPRAPAGARLPPARYRISDKRASQTTFGIRMVRTSNRSAAWADLVHPVPKHDRYACELPIGGSLSTVAVAIRLAVSIWVVGDVRRAGDGPDR